MINELTRRNAHTELDHIFKTILPEHGMTERPEQIRLSHTILDAMCENRIALSDAGTGIGKTYAYLTAAIVYSHSRLVDGLPFQPVIIATSSIALQNAIVREYLPFLSDALADDPHTTTPILAALRKGKSHYVCDERLRQHLQQRPSGKNAAQKRDLYSLRDVLDLDETQKLSCFDRERVCVPPFCDCKHPDCRYRRHLTECGQKRYLFQICNQNLWLADCMHRENGLKPILPDACTVIVDEAHKLPETAREMFGTTLMAGEIRSAVVRLKQDGYQSYLHAAEQRGVLPMFYLELSTGLRKGEIAALLWSDYDAQTQTIHVTKQYLFYNGQGTVSPPKSSTSVRYVSIPDEAAKLLEQEHEKHPKKPYMFPSPVTGEMYHPDAIVKIHRKICKDIGLENVRFHDLRHTFATLALQNGVDVKTVSSMLGHFDAGFTLRTYTHVTRQMQESAAEKMGNFMAQVM